MKVVLGWDFYFSIFVSSITVAIYVAAGGLFSAIFNEVLQFFLIWFGALLIPILGLIETGGWRGMVARIQHNFPGQDFTHMWGNLGHFKDNPMGMHWTGIVFGLAMVQSMGYWTTDFLVVQRVLSAKDIRSAKLAPVIGSFFKMAVPLIVILPGLLGLALLPMHLYPASNLQAGQFSYNEVLPLMLARYCGPGLLGLGITALVAGFMAGMAGNVSAFATVWTYDLYRPFIRKNAPDQHYVSMGRWCTLIGVFISIGTAYLAMGFASIMDYVQALFGFFIAPLFGTVLLGMMWKRVSRAAGFWGLLAGTISSITVFLLMHGKFPLVPAQSSERWIALFALSPEAKGLAQDMYQSLWSCVTCVLVTVLVTIVTEPRPDSELRGLVYSLTEKAKEEHASLLHRPAFWGVVSLVVLAILQIIFW
jgi:SSS family solute:Na+ symporter